MQQFKDPTAEQLREISPDELALPVINLALAVHDEDPDSVSDFLQKCDEPLLLQYYNARRQDPCQILRWIKYILIDETAKFIITDHDDTLTFLGIDITKDHDDILTFLGMNTSKERATPDRDLILYLIRCTQIHEPFHLEEFKSFKIDTVENMIRAMYMSGIHGEQTKNEMIAILESYLANVNLNKLPGLLSYIKRRFYSEVAVNLTRQDIIDFVQDFVRENSNFLDDLNTTDQMIVQKFIEEINKRFIQ